MKRSVLALHGFLGRGGDWDGVKAASPGDFEWHCPDLFAPGGGDWRQPPASVGKAWLAGYSFGARLALRWLLEEPRRWHGALLLSANPGNFQTDAARSARRESDAAWASAFRDESWDGLIPRWNAQDVLAGGAVPPRTEADYDRGKLADALEHFSVADQFIEAARLEGSLVWMAGARDAKFTGLLEAMREAGFPGVFHAVPGAGHRLLHEAPREVALALDRLTA